MWQSLKSTVLLLTGTSVRHALGFVPNTRIAVFESFLIPVPAQCLGQHGRPEATID